MFQFFMCRNFVSNLMICIFNGQTSFKSICFSYSKKIVTLLILLTQEGFIRGFFLKTVKAKKIIYVLLKFQNDNGNVRTIYCFSANAGLTHIKVNKLWQVKDGFSLLILSTSKGLLTHQVALKKHVGGFILLRLT